MSIGNELKKIALKVAYTYLDKDPENNLPHLMEWVDKYVKEDVLVVQRRKFREIIQQKDGSWYKLITSVWTDIDDNVRKAMFENLLINANALAAPCAQENREKYDCNIPWAIIIEIGTEEDSLTFDEIDSVIEQAKELGTYMFLIDGEGVTPRRDDVIAISNKHSDCQFMLFSNGDYIDEELAEELLRVKNILIAIALDGTGNEKPGKAAKILRERKLPFGVSCSYNKDNQYSFANDEFFDDVIGSGAKFCWMLSSVSDEDDRVYPIVKRIREEKPILAIDFCKDTEMIGGCAAGGKYYCSISANGDIEPCKFVHMSDSNIRTKLLLEAYQSPVFMEYHENCPSCRGKKKL